MNTFTRSVCLTSLLLALTCILSAQTINDKSRSKQATEAGASGKQYYDAGYRCLRRGAYDTAIGYLLPALSYYRQAGQRPEQAKIQNDLSLAYTELGLYEEALKLSLEALKYFEHEQDTVKIASVLINTGQLYNTLEQYGKAGQYLKMANAMLVTQKKTPKLSFLQASGYNNLATALLNNKHADSALAYYGKALQIKYTLGNDQSTAYTLNNIGTVYSDKKQYPEALHYYRLSLALKRKTGNTVGVARSFNNIGNLFLEQKAPQQAKAYFDSAYTLALTLNNPGLMSDVYANLARVYGAMQQYETAYRYQQQHIAIKDTLNNVAIAERTAELQTVYEADKRDKELQVYRSRLHVLKAEGHARANRIALLVAVTIALLVVLFLLLRILRLRQKNFLQKEALLLHEQELKEIENRNLKTEIDQRNQDLSALSLESLHKKEMILRVKEELGTVDQATQVTRLSRHIDSIYPDEEDWTTFKANFEKVHPGFFERINSLSDNISLLDLRHCAYIRIGLITKEIAGLLHIAPESVQKSRVRLKKKMGLSKETDLIAFIQAL